ncbi:uncharacterized protein N7483_012449 [Penicillium malachiteum]|uniref:uncharacterized protein n=1 Tax=Penicillium malachiteum TaxID=1324776 RepID=UPI0025480830|nr:uncharacterized protein N7483_012449 [Penicillium malachiteum]KAJ5715268.1 hypothetical protein N7483_012449 [Penicillium malachiteum]
MQPENIPAGALTHMNLAFVQFGDDWKMVNEYGDIVTRVTRLKTSYPGLRVNAALGDWNFNDPPSIYYFLTMAGSYGNCQTFIDSLISYMQKYGLDGVEIDWEYPAAEDRGGNPDDTENFVTLLAELREAFDAINPGWEITCTLPSSYCYDLHGMWDQDNKNTGSYLRGDTNLTEIDEGFDLLWRNDIDPKKGVMGMGFYGRSFTMSNKDCHTADCTFSAVGGPGPCSQSTGILYYSEIESTNSSGDVTTYYDPVSTVKYNVYNGNQWISYNDAQSWQDNVRYLTSKCISGVMIWALDEDDGMHTALRPSDAQKEELTDQYSAHTGQNCYGTEECTDGSSFQNDNAEYVCGTGFSFVDTAHAPQQKLGYWIGDTCKSGTYRHICCPTNAMPTNFEWSGAPIRSEIGCNGKCGSDQFQLNVDSYIDASVEEPCYQGDRALCCDSAETIAQCKWTSCQHLGSTQDKPTCPSGSTYMTHRYDDGTGSTCASDDDNSLEIIYAQAYCCPTDNLPSNCSWPFDNLPHTDANICYPSACDSTQVQYMTALDPAESYFGDGLESDDDCLKYAPPANSEKWPVDPKDLWENYYEANGDDVEWAFVKNYGNNNEQKSPGDGDGDDPYGFVMLDGPAGSIDSSFASTYEFFRRSEEIPVVKRSLFTTNRTQLYTNFDHVEETHHIFCKFPTGSPKCDNLLFDGAEDTIVHLPEHIGEGPFALKRQSQDNQNAAYKIKIDYKFQAIKRDSGAINMRVDYTNLLDYWEDATNTPATLRRKRSTTSVRDEHMTYKDWRDRVNSAKASHEALRKRQADVMSSKTSFEHSGDVEHAGLQKRWFGSFKNWLQKMNTIDSSSVGNLSQAWKASLLLFSVSKRCPKTIAELNVFLDSELAMDSTYAYYLSGTLAPSSMDGTYAYFGMQPSIYLGINKLIPTLSYPGLAIKGIAAVGPTLDVYGQIRGVVQLSGTMPAGARYTFEKSEVFWPEGDGSTDYSKIKDLVDDPEPVSSGLEPSFQANVQASADLDIMVTPEANIGIVVGGSALLGGVTLVDAQLAGFVNTTLRFHAGAAAGASGDSSCVSVAYAYNYDWYTTTRYLFSSPKTIILYSNEDVASVSTASSSKRRVSMHQSPIFDGDNAKIADPSERQSMARLISFDSNRDLLWGSQPQFMNGTSQSLRKREDDDANDCATPGSSNDDNLPVCSWILPELRYNCDVFSDAQATKNGATEQVTGICNKVLNFFRPRAIDDDRRDEACPKVSGLGFCSARNTNIANKLSLPTTTRIVSCDEFPIASSEEGESYFASLPQNLTSVEVQCVPVWQQSLQGNCHKMLSNLQSDVNVSGTANWQSWAPANEDWFEDSAWQRVDYNNGHVAQPSGPSDGAAWGLQYLSSWDLPGKAGSTSTDVTQVASAINTFGQDDRYINGVKNGLCITGTKQNTAFGTVVKTNGCRVVFTGSTVGHSNSKRDGSNEAGEEDEVIGEIGGWGIKSIEIPEDSETEIFVLDPDEEWAPHGHLMPVKYVD